MRNLIRATLALAEMAAFMTLTGISSASAAINVVAATPELADIAKQVGGDKVSVYSIAKPNQDYHMIEPRPSDVSKIARADIIVRIGLDLDMWLDALSNAASNPKVRRGASGYVDASVGVMRLEVPREQITGASGDIHVYGNPHYFYDPENGKIVAHNILEGLIRVSPGNRSAFQSNYEHFANEIDNRTAAWKKELAPYRGRPVVTYHSSSVYFLRRFSLVSFGQLEPKPGIPPSASHVRELIQRMKEHKVTAVAIESVYPRRFPDLIARETGAKYVVVPYSVGSLGTRSYIDLIDAWVTKYKEALR
jgi:zinc/manganese transport system substrate-binding protein